MSKVDFIFPSLPPLVKPYKGRGFGKIQQKMDLSTFSRSFYGLNVNIRETDRHRERHRETERERERKIEKERKWFIHLL